MQEFTAAPIAMQNLVWPPPWEKRVRCCFPDPVYPSRPRCVDNYYPVWYQCNVVHNPFGGYGCTICYPPNPTRLPGI